MSIRQNSSAQYSAGPIDTHLRLEALNAAVTVNGSSGGNSANIVAAAQKFYEFLTTSV